MALELTSVDTSNPTLHHFSSLKFGVLQLVELFTALDSQHAAADTTAHERTPALNVHFQIGRSAAAR